MNGDTQGWMLCSLYVNFNSKDNEKEPRMGGAEMEIRKKTVFHRNLLHMNDYKHCLQRDNFLFHAPFWGGV